jgi:hypothetical protein
VDHERDPWLARLEHADNCAPSVFTQRWKVTLSSVSATIRKGESNVLSD